MGKAQLRRSLHIAAALIAAALAIGLYKAKSDAARTEAHVRQLETAIADTESEMRALRADIARTESPANIEALAKERLGLTVGAESSALPQTAINRRLPAAERPETQP